MATLFPNPLITERLTIRGQHPDYAPAVNRAIRESMEELRVWMRWADHIPELEETVHRAAAAAERAAAGEDYGLVVFENSTGEFVLASGLHYRDREVPSFETGYWRRTGYGGRGYVTEATLAVTQAAFEVMGARRVEIRCDVDNLKSRAVAERCGYVLEGVLVNDIRRVGGELRSTALYALTR